MTSEILDKAVNIYRAKIRQNHHLSTTNPPYVWNELLLSSTCVGDIENIRNALHAGARTIYRAMQVAVANRCDNALLEIVTFVQEISLDFSVPGNAYDLARVIAELQRIDRCAMITKVIEKVNSPEKRQEILTMPVLSSNPSNETTTIGWVKNCIHERYPYIYGESAFDTTGIEKVDFTVLPVELYDLYLISNLNVNRKPTF